MERSIRPLPRWLPVSNAVSPATSLVTVFCTPFLRRSPRHPRGGGETGVMGRPRGVDGRRRRRSRNHSSSSSNDKRRTRRRSSSFSAHQPGSTPSSGAGKGHGGGQLQLFSISATLAVGRFFLVTPSQRAQAVRPSFCPRARSRLQLLPQRR